MPYIAPGERTDWRTPKHIYEQLVPPLWDVSDRHDSTFDALSDEWPDWWYCNPPYGREIKQWTARMSGNGVALLPAYTDVAWFHDYILGKCEIIFIRGRLHFDDAKQGAAFASIFCCFGEGAKVAKSVTRRVL